MRFNRFLAGEFKRAAPHYDRAAKRKWRQIERTFEKAKECVREREAELQRWEIANRRMEHIKAGGSPYDF